MRKVADTISMFAAFTYKEIHSLEIFKKTHKKFMLFCIAFKKGDNYNVICNYSESGEFALNSFIISINE